VALDVIDRRQRTLARSGVGDVRKDKIELRSDPVMTTSVVAMPS
jgi:hypothetical protein